VTDVRASEDDDFTIVAPEDYGSWVWGILRSVEKLRMTRVKEFGWRFHKREICQNDPRVKVNV
jgi:hypothetical protein